MPHQQPSNYEIGWMLEEIGDLLDIKGEDSFKVRAYRRAAQVLRGWPEDIAQVAREGRLLDLPGVGKALAQKIEEGLRTGTCRALERLRQEIPSGLRRLLDIPGLGGRTVGSIWRQLGITTLEELEVAGREHRLRVLRGMGAKKEENILHGIELLRSRLDLSSLGLAWPVGRELLGYLRILPEVERAEMAGSVRRGRELVQNLDLVVASSDPHRVMEFFLHMPVVDEVLTQGGVPIGVNTGCSATDDTRDDTSSDTGDNTRGDTRGNTGGNTERSALHGVLAGGDVWASVRIRFGLQVDLRVVPPSQFPCAWQYFTGSKEHNVRLRGKARERGYELNQKGLFGVEGKPLAVRAEEDIYRWLELQYIPPELREDRGEIEAAERGALPSLVREEDIQGDLHCHSDWSDGGDSLEDMAAAAIKRGYRYLAICDHSRSLGVANGLDVDRLRRQGEKIAALNEKFREEGRDFRLLHGTEVDILADGRLDFPDEVLAELDVVVASIHTGFRQDEERVTARLEQALRNPHVDIIGHPTGRLLGRRPPYAVDVDRLLELARETGTALEINASPDRLDLGDELARRAALENGIPLVINTDAHSHSGLGDIHFGVQVARRAWLQRHHILNAGALDPLLKFLRRSS